MTRHVDEFLARGRERLPGIVYGFNIASFKERNMHLGHTAGDADVADLERILHELEPSVVVKRTHGDRWLALAPSSVDIRSVLDRFARSEAFAVGWEVTGTKEGRTMASREVVPAEIMRAVRCLFAPVATATELDAAVAGILENDYSLPVQRAIPLADVPSMERRPWSCVSLYPTGAPACPFCGGRDLDDADADGSVYTADGTCTGCHARISIRGVTRSLG